MKTRLYCLTVLLITVIHTGILAQTYNWNSVAIGGGGFVSGIITSKTTANLMYARTDVGGAYRWNSATSKWIPLLDWCSINQTGYQGVESIALDPHNPNYVYMLVGTSYFNGGNTAILRSTDQGNTFTINDVSSQFKAHGNGMGRQNGERLAVDPNLSSTLFCGSRANGLWKSTNSGTTWTSANAGALTVTSTTNANGINFVVFDPTGTVGSATQTFFVGVSQTSNNLYKTTNGGGTFTAVTGGPTLMPQRAVMASDKNLYITYADNEGPWNINNGQIWKYNTTTSVWTNISPTPATYTFGYGGISVDPANPLRILASSTNAYWTQYPSVYGDRFFLSTDGGTTWKDLVNSGITLNANGCTWMSGGNQSIHWAGCIEFNPFNTAQAHVISGNGLFTCDNVNAASTTWYFNAIGVEETVPLDIASITGGPMFSVIGDYDGFKHTDVTVFAPIHSPRMGTTTGFAYGALSTSTLLRVGGSTGAGKMYYSTDQGTNWTLCSSINGYQGKVAVSANGSVFIHCPAGSSSTYRSTNQGSSWSTCSGISIGDAVPVADMVNTNKIYAYNSTSGSMMISTDAGANFVNTGSPGTGGSKIIRTVPGQEGHIWVAMYGGGLKRSVNSGSSFTTISGVSSCDAVGLGKAAPAAAYFTIYIWGTVGGVTGVFSSIDQGVTWIRVNDNSHQYGGTGNGQFVIGDWNIYGRVYMSTVGRGIAYADIATPAPVELVSFSAALESETVNLYWQTGSEKNNSHFIIEKSIDGKNFTELAVVLGAGNSSAVSNYSYADKYPVAGINYYRLKQVDFDNQYTYSDIRMVKVDSYNQINIYPNPANEWITISFLSNFATIEITDVLGIVVYQQKDLHQSEAVIDISRLNKGVYFIKISNDSKSLTGRFVKE